MVWHMGVIGCRPIKSVAEHPVPGSNARSQQSSEGGGPLSLWRRPRSCGKSGWVGGGARVHSSFSSPTSPHLLLTQVYPAVTVSAWGCGPSVWPEDPGLFRRRHLKDNSPVMAGASRMVRRSSFASQMQMD
ncbi:uncharacterized protein ACIQIH_000270 isoform 1-T1 [Cyanocitta cristata]